MAEGLWVIGLLSLLVLLYAAFYFLLIIKPTLIYSQEKTWQHELLKECPSLRYFFPSIFLINSHLQTIGVKFFRTAPNIIYEREYVTLEDGGHIALDWDLTGLDFDAKAPTVIILHGLVGSSTSKYIRNLVECLRLRGWRAVVLNARGCGTSTLKTPKLFNAEKTDDLRSAIKHIKSKYSQSPVLGAGYSLGANILTKYLGEEKSQSQIMGAVSVSNPFDLREASEYSRSSWSNGFYSKILTRDLHRYLRRHEEVLGRDVDYFSALKSKDLGEFDECVTIKMFDFKSITEYYQTASCVHVMKQIAVPVLFLNAMDDPVVTSTCIPYRMSQSNPNLLFAITNRGGHTAFLKNIKFWRKAWSDDVIEEFLAAILRNAGEIVDDAPNIKEDASLLAN